MSVIIRRPWHTSQQTARFAPKWQGVAAAALLGSQDVVSVGGTPVVRLANNPKTVSTFGPGTTFASGATNLHRALIPNSKIGTESRGGAFLYVFSTTHTATFTLLAGLGSDSGSSGNTVFIATHGASNAAHLQIITGGSNNTFATNFSGVTINDGLVHTVLFSNRSFTSGSSSTHEAWLDGVYLGSATDGIATGVANTYNWICAGGNRRTTDNVTGSTHSSYLSVAFHRALTVSEGIELTRDPRILFAPQTQRIWVPSAAAGVPTLTSIAASSITSSGAVLTIN